VLQWARVNGCPWDEYTCMHAAQGGHLAVLRWARGNGCPWDALTCTHAAFGGHLSVLQWARENGCPWNEYTCANAAQVGHLAVLRWARANGCPWNASMVWYGMVWCPSYPPSVCSVTEGGGLVASCIGLGQIYPSERVNIPSAEYPF
jgi:hypothetical protein